LNPDFPYVFLLLGSLFVEIITILDFDKSRAQFGGAGARRAIYIDPNPTHFDNEC
jgi:hypothetical protein